MIDEFKADLKLLTSKQMFRRYLLSGGCHALNEGQYFRLKEEICEHLNIEYNDIVLVGSGKLGFSIKPKKRYVPFGEDSDIDIAVVSTRLFQKTWEEAFLHKKSGADWPTCDEFFRYLSAGWIRPDKLPSGRVFNFTGKWWEFFNALTSSRKYGPYKIRGGIYHSFFFLQEYQSICIEQCKESG